MADGFGCAIVWCELRVSFRFVDLRWYLSDIYSVGHGEFQASAGFDIGVAFVADVLGLGVGAQRYPVSLEYRLFPLTLAGGRRGGGSNLSHIFFRKWPPDRCTVL